MVYHFRRRRHWTFGVLPALATTSIVDRTIRSTGRPDASDVARAERVVEDGVSIMRSCHQFAGWTLRIGDGALLAGVIAFAVSAARAQAPTIELRARIVAIGIPEIGGVRQIGRFHAGGAIPGNPEFLMQTRPGRMLDPERLMVTSGSNFGAPPASAALAPGSVLSITAGASTPLIVPPRFAEAGGQSIAANGAIQLYTAQSAAFVNRIHNSRAETAHLPAVAGPRYISINNGFGRPWLASGPMGANGIGLNTVLDPNGRPLDNAPSSSAGGVFAGVVTNRIRKQLTPGDLSSAALGTAFLGPSPDTTELATFAVFAVVKADGSVVQVHVQDGVDGLEPAGTVRPLPSASVSGELIGMAFNWVPDRILFVSDRASDRIARLVLSDDGRHFTLARVSYLTGRHFKGPSDIAPAIPEIANPRFSSHTTLAGNSDLYIANRSDGSIVRITQAGELIARAIVRWPSGEAIGSERLRGIAIAADAQRIWVTIDGEIPGHPGLDGAVIEVSGFDGEGSFRRTPTIAPAVALDANPRGKNLFTKMFTPEEGLGPLFNARSCATCHSEPSTGGTSSLSEHFAVRVAHLDPRTGRVTPLPDHPLPIAPRFSTRELGEPNAPRAGVPGGANVTSMRMPTALYGLGMLDRIPDEAILAHAVAKGDGIRGRPNRVVTATGERRIGRYGWKADVATLDEMIATAFANELGITSPLAPGRGANDDPHGSIISAVSGFLRSLVAPAKQRTQ